ncbi:hypothetical protein [Paenibacillus sp. HW567]|uniref:hypothetical protein n=1 Tax=Paenibacillus sp. HW567 TaxID=1034769 RepID=UPI0003785374|nr:hypothetical protein [Paenibacillus sp. HW567]
MKLVKIMQSATLIVLLFLITACGDKEESATKKLELPAADLKNLVIEHRNGEIKVTGSSDSDKIEVVASAKARGIDMDKLELKLEAQKDNAYLEAQFQAQFLALGAGTVDLEVKVPKQISLHISTHRDGNIDVSNIGSDVVINNINGHITVDQVGGSAEIHVGDGSLDINHVAQDATITQTGHGDITIGEVKGKLVQNKN